MDQIPMFGVFRSATLMAESPKQAFYRIWIECDGGKYYVCKESGSGAGKVCHDRRRWPVESPAAALEKFESIILKKTNPNRKSPRKYRLICMEPHERDIFQSQSPEKRAADHGRSDPAPGGHPGDQETAGRGEPESSVVHDGSQQRASRRGSAQTQSEGRPASETGGVHHRQRKQDRKRKHPHGQPVGSPGAHPVP